MNFNFNTRRFARTIVLLGSIAAATLLSGCAGLQVGPGTTTGAGLGAVIGGLSSRDPVSGIVRGGIIGGAIGAIGDAANGVPPVQSGGYYDNRPYQRPPDHHRAPGARLSGPPDHHRASPAAALLGQLLRLPSLPLRRANAQTSNQTGHKNLSLKPAR